MKAVFLRAIEAPVEEKAEALRQAVRAGASAGTRFEVELESFRQVPRAPFAYWVSSILLDAFATNGAFEGVVELPDAVHP